VSSIAVVGKAGSLVFTARIAIEMRQLWFHHHHHHHHHHHRVLLLLLLLLLLLPSSSFFFWLGRCINQLAVIAG
jgi:hypothetical protein